MVPGGKKSANIWLVALVCFAVMSPGGIYDFGIPRILITTSIVVLIMFLDLRFKIDRAALVFAMIYLMSFLPGAFNASFRGGIDPNSFANLIISILFFIVVYTYTKSLLNSGSMRAELIVKSIDYTFIFFIIFSFFEILNYSQFCDLRSYYYGDKFECQLYRDATTYGFPRPTGYFSEPSNFARFLSVLLCFRLVFNRNITTTVAWGVVFLLLTRSPTLLYTLPVVLIVVMTRLNYSKGRFSRGVQYLTFGLGGLVLGIAFLYSQQDRLDDISSGSEGSFQARIVYPIEYLATSWENPFLGGGPTPLDKVDEFALTRYIADGNRLWLLGTDSRIGLSPAPIVIAALGVLGVSLLFGGMILQFGWTGILMLFVFFASNFLNVGFNSPSMYVPSAMLLAITEFIRRQKSVTDMGECSGTADKLYGLNIQRLHAAQC
ncbi:MAG: hypothetical protein EWV63_21400 [Microcystis aeruginosa Ma_OC_H_19870700_S124]|uniref:O-antigen ligase domain-containing protein n=1 Tax=Microcystis aeruginosa Ma_OC_H_19870700_S124 TaxID=2486262 RepID=A0A552A8F9_MICAE|nr:MAG: hypothetical protein EWV63_21400 [Microcystis aeruginosa Ma_OC_H_19870700_S124]